MKALRLRILLPAVLVFAVAFASFSPSLSYSLVNLDDQEFITHNPIIYNGFSWAGMRSAFTQLHGDQTMYVPLLWISYLLDVKFFGATSAVPWGFHFTNVLLHAANALLLFLLLFAFCKKPWRAFFFAALWALHPLRVESVAWVTERKDVLSGFFALLCMGAYVGAHSPEAAARGNRRSSGRRRLLLGVSFAFFLCGLLVKPMLVTIPGLLLLLDVWPLRRMACPAASRARTAQRLLLEKLPFIAGAAFAAMAVYLTQAKAISAVPLWARLYAITAHYLFYLGKSLFPLGLSPMVPAFAIPIPVVLTATAVLTAITAGLWMRRRNHAHELVGWLAFLGLLFPVSGIVVIGIHPVADRYSYLPAIGLSIALLGLLPAGDRQSARWFALLRAGLAVAILGILAGLTSHLLPTWKNDANLYGRTARRFPGHYAATHYLAREAYFTHGDLARANLLADQLLAREPCRSFGLIMKAICLSQMQSIDAAWQFARTNYPPCDNLSAPGMVEYHLAMLAFLAHHPEPADQFMQTALRLGEFEPKSREQLRAVATLLAHERGDLPASLAHAAHVAALRHKSVLAPEDFLPAYTAIWRSGYHAQTLAYFRRLTQSDPPRPDLLNNVAWLLATTAGSPADPEEIVQMARRALAGAPGHPLILDTLAVALANAGDFDAALATSQQAADLLATATDPSAPNLLRGVEKRMALYRAGQPFREDSAGRLLYAP